MQAYADFLARKAISDPATGLVDLPMLPDCLFPFQRDIVSWALRRGRAALFAGTGLGKSLMELAWGQAVAAHTGGMVLLLAPLAVAAQMMREAEKFGIPARIVSCQAECGTGINISNYQKIAHFDLTRFAGVILDESSILKSTDGHYRSALIAACAQVPFRLAASATPAPNDFMELGNHAEFLGVMSYTDMLATFFVHDGGSVRDWRLKGHAENEFWRWMASWAVMLRKPSDLGYANDGYDLPPLVYHQHDVAIDAGDCGGFLFPMPATTLKERIAARRGSVEDRVRAAFGIVIGSYDDKLAAWDGNRNTPSADAPNINPTQPSASGESRKGARPTKTPSICANITSDSLTSSSERANSRTKSTGVVASDMPPIPSSAKRASPPRRAEIPTLAEMAGCDQHTGSAPKNSTPLSSSKTDDAPFAAISQSDICSLITAMTAARSGACFAAPAIPASVISRMTRSGFVEPWSIWCNLNSEQDALAQAFGPLAYSVTGSMPDAQKEAAILNWIAGERPIMISKPSIMGFGMNFQHCCNTIFVGLNDSFEQYYQAIRRFWRFGQTQPVNCHIVAAETEGATVANIRRKEADAERMAAAMVLHMADLSSSEVRGMTRDRGDYNPTLPVRLPAFLEAA